MMLHEIRKFLRIHQCPLVLIRGSQLNCYGGGEGWVRANVPSAYLAILLSLLPLCSPAQEAVRLSLAGERAAEDRLKSSLSLQHSLLRLGPATCSLAAGLDLEANDNITFASSGARADLTLRPQLQTSALLRISNHNLNLALDTGYSACTIHPAFNRFFIGPASGLSFDLYAGDLWLNLHERLSVTQNAYDDPTVFGTADYSQLQNVAGLNATWDLNKFTGTFGYDHALYHVLTGGNGFPDGTSDVLALSFSYRASPTTQIGVQAGCGLIDYEQTGAGSSRATDWNLGACLASQPFEYVTVRAAAGYTVYAPQGLVQNRDYTGFYFQLSFQHRLNQYLEYDLSAGRNINFGFYEGTIDLYTLAWETRWRLFRKLSLSTGFLFEHGSQVLVGRESFTRLGPRVTLERSLGAKFWAALRYQFFTRDSNQTGAGYQVNILTANLTYRL